MNPSPFFVHLRPMTIGPNGDKVQATKWAATAAMASLGNDVLVGISLCSPKDNFSRKRGREIAFGRLMSDNAIVLKGAYDKINTQEDIMRMARIATLMFAISTFYDLRDFEDIARDLYPEFASELAQVLKTKEQSGNV